MSQHLKHFTEKDIDSFREAFYLFAKNRNENPIYIRSVDELCVITRSLGLSPTIKEITAYMKKYNNKMSFSDFLEVVHTHSRGKRKLRNVASYSQQTEIVSFQLKSFRTRFSMRSHLSTPRRLEKSTRGSSVRFSRTGARSWRNARFRRFSVRQTWTCMVKSTTLSSWKSFRPQFLTTTKVPRPKTTKWCNRT